MHKFPMNLENHTHITSCSILTRIGIAVIDVLITVCACPAHLTGAAVGAYVILLCMYNYENTNNRYIFESFLGLYDLL